MWAALTAMATLAWCWAANCSAVAYMGESPGVVCCGAALQFYFKLSICQMRYDTNRHFSAVLHNGFLGWPPPRGDR
ncbi:MAG TPA: hypothetical protein VLW45_05165, partial [Pelomicrobium sp.]|nr:hypothetical protein [Pelomicrobium sp.]